MNEYTYFGPNVMVFEEEGKLYKVPSFVERSRKSYRFDHKNKILQKQCIDCKEYFDAQIFEEGKFRDVHDEEKIHFSSYLSGYATRCK
jgi:hypothetical protein